MDSFRVAAFEQALVGMAIATPDGVLEDVNDALCAFLGRSREQLVGARFGALTHPGDVEETRRRTAEVLAGGADAFEQEKRYLRPDGTTVWGLLSLRLMRDEDGEPRCCFTQIIDITARKQAEQALAESERRTRSIVSSLAEGVCMFDAEGRIVEINESAASIVGVAAGQAVGRTMNELGVAMVTEDGEQLAADALPIAQALRRGAAQAPAVVRVRHADGSIRVLAGSTTPLVASGSSVPYAVVASFADDTERLAAEDALRASEKRYRTLAATVPAGIFRTDTEGSCTFVNERWCATTGMSAEGARGRGWAEALHPDDRDMVVGDFARATAAGSEFAAELRFLAADGTVRYVASRATPEHDEDGTLTGYVGSVLDVTEQRAAEHAVRATQAHHRLVLRNLPGSSIAAYDRELRCLLLEGPYAQEAGLDPDRVVGKHLTELLPPDSPAALEGAMRAALAGEEQAVDYRSPITGRHLIVRVLPYRDEQGHVVGVINISHDVTATREAQQRQRAAEVRFQVAFDRAPIGMCLSTLDGRFLQVNAAMSEITGYSRDDLEATSFAAITHPDDRSLLPADLETATEPGTRHTVEKRYVHADGHDVWVAVEATVIHDEDGRPMHLLAQVQDVTERKRREDRLQHLADHDALTGLLNRRGFEQALASHVAHCRRNGPDGALLVLDLDGLKQVNDTFGHRAGDELIISCARALEGRLRESDVIARLGGDEFAVLLPRASQDAAGVVASGVLETIRRQAGNPTASVGVAVFDDAGPSARQILANADRAMYQAKDAGKGRCAFHRP